MNEMNDVERIRAVAAILCCVPVEVKERILLYFNVHTVVEGEHVLTKRNYYALSLSLSLSPRRGGGRGQRFFLRVAFAFCYYC